MTSGALCLPGCLLGLHDGDLTEPMDDSYCPTSAPKYCAAVDQCVDLSTDVANCGACDVACSRTKAVGAVTCITGACAVATCVEHFADCDGSYATGCETDVRTSKEHCGACGQACATQCVGGVCDDPIEVSAGYEYTCVVRALGSVWCWGANGSQNLGNGTDKLARQPVQVQPLAPAVNVTAGKGDQYQHTCALLKDGTVWCWGSAEFGHLGTGDTNDSGVPIPAMFPPDTKVAQVEAGGTHTCAVTTLRRLYCWGNHSSGALGTGVVNEDQTIPATVGNGYDSVAAGASHTCGRRHTDPETVYCWGANGRGQLGDGTKDMAFLPSLAAGAAGATALRLGTAHSCALFADGAVRCWGANSNGQLGKLDNMDQPHPQLVALEPGQALFTGFDATAALVGKDVWVWGQNSFGQLGTGTTETASAMQPATALNKLGPIKRLAFGAWHACAIVASGALYCWGDNSLGQLGDGTNQPSMTPIEVKLRQPMIHAVLPVEAQ